MWLSEWKILLLATILAISVKSSNSREIEIVRHKRATGNLYDSFIHEIQQLKGIPVVGTMLAPYLSSGLHLIQMVNKSSSGALEKLVNSILPCSFNTQGSDVKCQGTIDTASAKKVMRKVVEMIPTGSLPSSISAVLEVLTEML